MTTHRAAWIALLAGIILAGGGLSLCYADDNGASRSPVSAGDQAAALGRPLPMYQVGQIPPYMPKTGYEFVWPHPGTPWHAGYYHPAWGLPVAVVVPPRAWFETKYSWGVGGTQSAPICHQFSRNYPGPGRISRSGLMAAPRWPMSTDQLGAHAIRGPW